MCAGGWSGAIGTGVPRGIWRLRLAAVSYRSSRQSEKVPVEQFEIDSRIYVHKPFKNLYIKEILALVFK
jgi:hypothetical protein